MLEDLLSNLKSVTDQFQKSADINEKLKIEAMDALNEDQKAYVNSVEGVANRFAKDGDLTGLMNYMNSVQEKIKKDASND